MVRRRSQDEAGNEKGILVSSRHFYTFLVLITGTYNFLQGIQARCEATPAEMIVQLEEAREALVAKRIGLERKITELKARQGGMSREEAAMGKERR